MYARPHSGTTPEPDPPSRLLASASRKKTPALGGVAGTQESRGGRRKSKGSEHERKLVPMIVGDPQRRKTCTLLCTLTHYLVYTSEYRVHTSGQHLAVRHRRRRRRLRCRPRPRRSRRLNRRPRSTCGARSRGPTRRTPASRSTSAGRSRATRGSSRRSTPSTCARGAR